MSRSEGTGFCQVCDSPKPPGRTRYCSDACSALVSASRERVKAQKRMLACGRCGGPKELGVRGGKLCAECRRLMADASSFMESARGRQRSIKATLDRIAAGERVARRDADVPPGQKWCAFCQELLPVTSFPARKGGKGASYCKPCQKVYNSQRRLKLVFGLDWDEYELIFATQDFVCAICQRKPRSQLLAVDHNHKTGEIRGLLCTICNHRLLGAAKESPELLRRAADYLEQGSVDEVFGERRFVPGSRESA